MKAGMIVSALRQSITSTQNGYLWVQHRLDLLLTCLHIESVSALENNAVGSVKLPDMVVRLCNGGLAADSTSCEARGLAKQTLYPGAHNALAVILIVLIVSRASDHA